MSIFTPQEINRLYEPFALDEHEIREGATTRNGKIQWFVYVKRGAIQRRLDELFVGEWATSAEIYRGAKYVSAMMTLTIRGIARVFNGAEDGDFDENIEKSALTDTFKRVASMWGIGLYLSESLPKIYTDGYKDKDSKPDWTLKRQRENEAWEQFKRWYNAEIAKLPTGGAATTRETTPVLTEPGIPPTPIDTTWQRGGDEETIHTVKWVGTKKGHDQWEAWSGEGTSKMKFDVFPEDVNAIRKAGYDVSWAKDRNTHQVNITIITKWTSTHGFRIGEVLPAQSPEPQLPPAAAIFGQNEQKRIPTPEYSKTYEGKLTKIVDIQVMENGGKRYKFLTKGGRHVSCFGSDIFKAANIDTSDWKTQWKLDPPIPVRIEEKIGKDNRVYYNVTAVLSDTKGQAA